MTKLKIAILCGGRGKRLKSLTDDLPKPLIPLQNKPILEHILNFFEKKDFCEFIVCIGYKGKKIMTFIEEYKKESESIFAFSDLGENASIIRRMHALKDDFDDRILFTYGDTLTDLNVDELLHSHKNKRALMTIVASKIRTPFGLLEMDNDGWATSFTEKPVFKYYIGHLVMEKKVVSYINKDMLHEDDGQGLISLFEKLIQSKSLNVYEHHGAQITFNTEVEIINAEKEIIDFYSQKEEI